MDKRKPIPGFIPGDKAIFQKEGAVNLREAGWLPCEFRFRGLLPEIEKFRDYLVCNEIYITHQEALSGEVGEIRVIAEEKTIGLIEAFPALKATGLVENWNRFRDHGIYVVYSESGFSVITDYAYAGEFEGRNECGEGRWEWECDMMEPVNVSFTWLQTGDTMEVHYQYPFRSKWERSQYVRELDGEIYVSAADSAFQIENGVLLRYLGSGGHVEIPDTVTEIDIAAEPFRGNLLITSVRIPGTVSCVGDNAFEGCMNLESAVLEDGVAEIGASAFSGCTALREVSLPAGLKKIGMDAFRGCSRLDVGELYIPACEEMNTFGPFSGCKNVPQLLCSSDRTILFYSDLLVEQACVPDSVRKIQESAFAFRKKLTSVTLPSGLREIGRFAFSGCCNLQEIIIPDSVERIDQWAFSGCTSLKTIRIPGSIKVIPDAMLRECTALETVIIEEGITEIKAAAFEKCRKLKDVYLPSSIRKKIRLKLFEKNSALVIHGQPGSPAAVYAKEKGFRFASVE